MITTTHRRGFTLLEMLVVLVLTGMITSILMQGLHQVFQLQSRFGHELIDKPQDEMYIDWFRFSVNGLMPDYEDGKHKFKGTDKEFSGLTLSPLDVATEAMLPFSWRLRFDPRDGNTRLQYGAKDDAPAILAWTGNGGKFVYVDTENKLHDTWPPFLGKWPQLPKAIYLEIPNGEERRIIVAVPKGLDKPLPRQQDLLLD